MHHSLLPCPTDNGCSLHAFLLIRGRFLPSNDCAVYLDNSLLTGLAQVLRQASKLEVLQVCLPHPTIQDMDLITSLPALRKLFIYGREASEPLANAMLSLSRRAMPRVEVLLDADNEYFGEEFFKLRCAL